MGILHLPLLVPHCRDIQGCSEKLLQRMFALTMRGITPTPPWGIVWSTMPEPCPSGTHPRSWHQLLWCQRWEVSTWGQVLLMPHRSSQRHSPPWSFSLCSGLISVANPWLSLEHSGGCWASCLALRAWCQLAVRWSHLCWLEPRQLVWVRHHGLLSTRAWMRWSNALSCSPFWRQWHSFVSSFFCWCQDFRNTSSSLTGAQRSCVLGQVLWSGGKHPVSSLGRKKLLLKMCYKSLAAGIRPSHCKTALFKITSRILPMEAAPRCLGAFAQAWFI